MNSIDDELQQNAIKVMIRTYGQMPKQLFTSGHPEQLLQNPVTSISSSGTTSGAEKTAAAQQMLVYSITIDCYRVISVKADYKSSVSLKTDRCENHCPYIFY